MSQPMLSVAELRKRFGTVSILDVTDLNLAAGESYVLTGENGSGKTTLLRILAGLEQAECTNCCFGGHPVDLRAYPDWMRSAVVYVHQHPYLFRGTIADNIAYGLKARGVPVTARDALIGDAIAWAGIAHVLHVPPHKLSGGEKQRVALARARVLQPRLFLLDEPTASLDAEARQQTMALIRDLCDANSTVVLACHDREIIELPHMHRLHLVGGQIQVGGVSVPDD